jgi:hypothetical protein
MTKPWEKGKRAGVFINCTATNRYRNESVEPGGFCAVDTAEGVMS